MKNIGIIAAWIASVLLVGWFLFFFTQPVRNEILRRSINRLLIENGESGRLLVFPTRVSATGVWWTVSDTDERAVMFAIMDGGVPVPCIAFVNGADIEVKPLNNYAKTVYKRLSKGFIDIYIRRIEKEIKDKT
ncbi:MAG: hypothetical protein LBE74_08615 [Treponema sp.]|nr:hypothetical protein [Treponema sp.]